MLLLILGCLLILSACDQTKQKSIGNKIAITKDFHVSDSTNEYGQLGKRFYNYLSTLKSETSSLANYNDNISLILYKLRLDGELHIHFAKQEGYGDFSWFYFKEDENTAISYSYVASNSLFKRIKTECSPMSVWQIYLLYSSKTVLPMFWHAHYIKRNYIFSKADFKNVKNVNLILKNKDFSDIIEESDILPKVELYGNVAKVTCCYWNNWKGLLKETITIKFRPDSSFDIAEYVETEILFAYDCQVRY